MTMRYSTGVCVCVCVVEYLHSMAILIRTHELLWPINTVCIQHRRTLSVTVCLKAKRIQANSDWAYRSRSNQSRWYFYVTVNFLTGASEIGKMCRSLKSWTSVVKLKRSTRATYSLGHHRHLCMDGGDLIEAVPIDTQQRNLWPVRELWKQFDSATMEAFLCVNVTIGH